MAELPEEDHLPTPAHYLPPGQGLGTSPRSETLAPPMPSDAEAALAFRIRLVRWATQPVPRAHSSRFWRNHEPAGILRARDRVYAKRGRASAELKPRIPAPHCVAEMLHSWSWKTCRPESCETT